MDREYDIFERLPDDSLMWRVVVSGLENARQKLHEFAKGTTTEFLAMHTPTRQVVARINRPRVDGRATKRVFQIAYTEQLRVARAELLRCHGYGIVSVIGNESAKVLLSSIQHYDLFIIGHAAPEQIRKEMAAWLRANYPKVRILALNPPLQQLSGADYNTIVDSSEKWLSLVATAVSPPAEAF
jgi:hypothetical protein